ncbi:MAG: hypothetical protein R8K20_05170, partial [Gallionellaceae bacterium]
TELEARFVLAPLLGWSHDRLGGEADKLLELAMNWLRTHPTEPEAEFILSPLLDWSLERLGQNGSKLLNIAVSWLRKHPREPDIDFIIKKLLGWPREHLGNNEDVLLNLAMGWLREHAREPGAAFTIKRLLGWQKNRLNKVEGELISLAIVWLREHIEEPDAGFVLHPLFEECLQQCLGEVDTEGELLQLALKWLELFGKAQEACYVLTGLLLRNDLSPEICRFWCIRALELVEERQPYGDETHLLKTLLKLVWHSPKQIPWLEILVYTGKWLDEHPDTPQREYVLGDLLCISWLPDDVWLKIAKAAFDNLDSHTSDRLDGYLLNGLLERVKALNEFDQKLWATLSCRWIEKWGSQKDCDSLLNSGLKYFRAGVPYDIKTILGAAYTNRFPGCPFDWNQSIHTEQMSSPV